MKQDSATRGARIQKASRHRREQQKEELQQAILEAASALFVEQGYQGFSMRHLAERIGYSAATLYLYFRDKDDLLFIVVDEGYTRFARQLAEAAASSDEPWERLNQLSQAYITFGLCNPAYYQLMFMWRVDFLTQTRTGLQEPRLEAFDILRDAVEYAMDTGAMLHGDAGSISDALWAMMHGIVSLAITMPAFDVQRIQQLTGVAREMAFRAFSKG